MPPCKSSSQEEPPIILSKSEIADFDGNQPNADDQAQEMRATLKVGINESNVFIKEGVDADDEEEFQMARENSDMGEEDFFFENPHFSADIDKQISNESNRDH